MLKHVEASNSQLPLKDNYFWPYILLLQECGCFNLVLQFYLLTDLFLIKIHVLLWHFFSSNCSVFSNILYVVWKKYGLTEDTLSSKKMYFAKILMQNFFFLWNDSCRSSDLKMHVWQSYLFYLCKMINSNVIYR